MKKWIAPVGAMLVLMFLMGHYGPEITLDKKLTYTGAEAQAYFDGLSPREIGQYFLNEIFDLMFICAYTSVLWLSYRTLKPAARAWWLLALLPGVFDVMETGTILYDLQHLNAPVLIGFLGLFTLLKWLASALSVGGVLFLWVQRKRALRTR